MDISTDPSCSRTMDPDMAFSSSSGPDITTAPVAVQATLINHIALGHQYSLKCMTRSWASAQSSLVTGVMDINSDPDYYKTTDSDKALGSNSGLNVTMILGGNIGHSDQYDPSGGTAFGHQHGPRLQTRLWASV
ncbi:hypothetical protein STEG23_035322 [Scotinomys teguina]